MATSASCPSCAARLAHESFATGGLCRACLFATALEPDEDLSPEQSDDPLSDRLSTGSMFGGFRIIGLLGKGGMAAVYEAREAPPLERTVALKVLPPEFLHDETFAARFSQEARVVANLEHSSIVPIYASGIEGNLPWMSMRLLAGGSLSALLQQRRLPTEHAVRILRDVAEALDYAHAAGVIHRDIKASNILLDQTGRAWIGDFGVARLVERPSDLTATGAITGTPHYMAPEQALGTTVDHRSDIYSLGVVAYEMLTGSTPFQGQSPVAVLMRQVNDSVPVPPRDLVPDDVFAVLQKALAKSPSDRWPTATAFVAALEERLGRSRRSQSRGDGARMVRIASVIGATAVAGVFVWMMSITRQLETLPQDPLVMAAETTPPEPRPETSGEPVPIAVAEPPRTPTKTEAAQTPGRSIAAPSVAPTPMPPVEENERESDPPAAAEPEAKPQLEAVPAALETIAAATAPPLPEPAADVTTDAVVIHRVDPVYPEIAKRVGMQGDVVVRVTVGRDGEVTPVEILRSPHPTLTEAAKKAVQRYRITPATRNGVPVESRLVITITFQLK